MRPIHLLLLGYAPLVLLGSLYATVLLRPARTPVVAPAPAWIVAARPTITYRMDRVCDTEGDLRLTKVIKEGDSTRVFMTFTNQHHSSGYFVRAFPPGHQETFYLIDADTAIKYPLKNVEGLAIDPEVDSLERGQSCSFVLTFTALPESVRNVHVIEGEAESNNGIRKWRFMNVGLGNDD